MTVTVEEVAYSSPAQLTVHTADITVTPQSGDVIVVLLQTAANRSIVSISGCGATWAAARRFANSVFTADWWIGTSPSSSGTISVTVNSAASGQARAFLIRGLNSSQHAALFSYNVINSNVTLHSPKLIARENQVAICALVCRVTDESVLPNTTWINENNPSGWTTNTQANDTSLGNRKVYNTAYRIPASGKSAHWTGLLGDTAKQTNNLFTMFTIGKFTSTDDVDVFLGPIGSIGSTDIITVTENLDTSDVLILLFQNVTARDVISVSGCGATWSAVYETAADGSYPTIHFWKGINPGSAGDVTITTDLSADGMLRAYLLRGLTSTDFVGAEVHVSSSAEAVVDGPSKLASNGTIAIAAMAVNQHNNNFYEYPYSSLPPTDWVTDGTAWATHTTTQPASGAFAAAYRRPRVTEEHRVTIKNPNGPLVRLAMIVIGTEAAEFEGWGVAV